jgi:4-hydroxybenzoate polyprenyltransferase
MLIAALGRWGRMVKFSHTLFALPFALSGALLAGPTFEPRRLAWIVLAMVGARNAAMGFNRLADHAIDGRNPRTAKRELPAGMLSRSSVWIMTALLSLLFIVAAFQLSPLCGWLSPVALAVIFGYSYAKRFTWASHLLLGIALAMAPVGGWLAVRGELAATPWLLGAAVMCWVAGFDVIYACQDLEFDREAGLHSIPARLGLVGALRVARLLHGLALIALIATGLAAELSPIYWIGLTLIAALILWQHRMVRPDDLSRLGGAFLNMNAAISVIYLATTATAVWWPLSGVN